MTTLIFNWLVNICDKIADFMCTWAFAVLFGAYTVIMVAGFFIGINLGPKNNIDD